MSIKHFEEHHNIPNRLTIGCHFLLKIKLLLLGHLDKIIHATWRQPVIRKILFSRLYYYPPRVEAVLDWTLEKEMKLEADRKSEDTLIID